VLCHINCLSEPIYQHCNPCDTNSLRNRLRLPPHQNQSLFAEEEEHKVQRKTVEGHIALLHHPASKRICANQDKINSQMKRTFETIRPMDRCVSLPFLAPLKSQLVCISSATAFAAASSSSSSFFFCSSSADSFSSAFSSVFPSSSS